MASHKYQKLKINQLEELNLPKEEHTVRYNEIVGKECLCVGLSNSASVKYAIPFIKNRNEINICPGPNIAYFDKVVSLKEMTDHIYGRANILTHNNRPHMFIKEIDLNIDYIKEQVRNLNKTEKQIKAVIKYIENLVNGIEYYKVLAGSMFSTNFNDRYMFLNTLIERENEIIQIQGNLE